MSSTWKVTIFLVFALLALPITALLSQYDLRIHPTISQDAMVLGSDSTCKTGLNSFGVTDACGDGNFRHAQYTCYDGVSGTLGESTSCKPSKSWYEAASIICQGHSSCALTPTPQISVIPSPTSLPGCTRGVRSTQYTDTCTIPGYTPKGSRGIQFKCYDGSGGTLRTQKCQFQEGLLKSAEEFCVRYDSTCVNLSPTPTRPALSPTATKAPEPTRIVR